ASAEGVALQLVGVHLELGEGAAGGKGTLAIGAGAVADVEVDAGPFAVVVGVADDLGGPTVAEGVDGVGEGGQRGVAGVGDRRVDGGDAGSVAVEGEAVDGDGDAGLLVGGDVVVDDLEDGDGAVADALHADDRVLAQEEAAVAVAGVELVVGGLDEVAATVLLDGG